MSHDTQNPTDLTHRLRCKYPVGPMSPNGEPEFGWRDMSGPIETVLPTPLMLEAADYIDGQAEEIERLKRTCRVAVLALAHASQEHGEVYRPAYQAVSEALQGDGNGSLR